MAEENTQNINEVKKEKNPKRVEQGKKLAEWNRKNKKTAPEATTQDVHIPEKPTQNVHAQKVLAQDVLTQKVLAQKSKRNPAQS